MALTFVYCLAFMGETSAFPMSFSRPPSTRSSNQTDPERSWVANPTGRGTLDIIFSCITTLFLCSYTAFHPNTPAVGGYSALWKRLKYMGFTIVFPGYILYYALKQLKEAFNLRDKSKNEALQIRKDATASPGRWTWVIKINKFLPWTTGPTSSTRWNLEQAFFAACGGVAVDPSNSWPDARRQFTAAGISMLIECQKPPEIPLESVRARSNADLLSKGATCLQALWFVIQSCARLRSGLPLTLLETHIFIHVGCTLLTYLVWLRKPYAVSLPLLCRDQETQDLAALFALSCHPALHDDDRPQEAKAIKECDASHNEIAKDSGWRLNELAEGCTASAAHLKAAKRAVSYLRGKEIDIKWEECQHGKIVFPERNQLVVEEIPNMDNLGINDLRVGDPKYWGQRKPPHEIWHFVTLQMLSAAYGLCYLAVWRSHFPSTVEMWLWRAACLSQFAVFLAGLVGRLIGLLANMIRDNTPTSALRQQILQHRIARDAVWLIQHLFAASGAAASVITLLARLYLFTEAWISLRDPPQHTYTTVHWTAYIPHIS